MEKISITLARLFSRRNLIAACVAYVCAVLITWLMIILLFQVILPLALFLLHKPKPAHWFISRAWFILATHISYAALICVPVLCQIKIEHGTKNKAFEKILDKTLSVLMWCTFALMAIFFVPALHFIKFLQRRPKEQEWAPILSDIIFGFLCITSVFVLGIGIKITGSFPKRRNLFVTFLKKWRKQECPAEKPYVIVFSHESSLDYFIWPAGMGFMHSKIMAGTNLTWFPIVGDFISVKSILVDRDDDISRKEAAEAAAKYLKQGVIVAMAPEAGRRRQKEPGVLRDIEKWDAGAFVLACRQKVDIIPVNINGSGEVKPPVKGVVDNMWKFWQYQWECNFKDVNFDILEAVSTTGKMPSDVMIEVFQKMESAKLSKGIVPPSRK